MQRPDRTAHRSSFVFLTALAFVAAGDYCLPRAFAASAQLPGFEVAKNPKLEALVAELTPDRAWDAQAAAEETRRTAEARGWKLEVARHEARLCFYAKVVHAFDERTELEAALEEARANGEDKRVRKLEKSLADVVRKNLARAPFGARFEAFGSDVEPMDDGRLRSEGRLLARFDEWLGECEAGALAAERDELAALRGKVTRLIEKVGASDRVGAQSIVDEVRKWILEDAQPSVGGAKAVEGAAPKDPHAAAKPVDAPVVLCALTWDDVARDPRVAKLMRDGGANRASERWLNSTGEGCPLETERLACVISVLSSIEPFGTLAKTNDEKLATLRSEREGLVKSGSSTALVDQYISITETSLRSYRYVAFSAAGPASGLGALLADLLVTIPGQEQACADALEGKRQQLQGLHQRLVSELPGEQAPSSERKRAAELRVDIERVLQLLGPPSFDPRKPTPRPDPARLVEAQSILDRAWAWVLGEGAEVVEDVVLPLPAVFEGVQSSEAMRSILGDHRMLAPSSLQTTVLPHDAWLDSIRAQTRVSYLSVWAERQERIEVARAGLKPFSEAARGVTGQALQAIQQQEAQLRQALADAEKPVLARDVILSAAYAASVDPRDLRVFLNVLPNGELAETVTQRLAAWSGCVRAALPQYSPYLDPKSATWLESLTREADAIRAQLESGDVSGAKAKLDERWKWAVGDSMATVAAMQTDAAHVHRGPELLKLRVIRRQEGEQLTGRGFLDDLVVPGPDGQVAFAENTSNEELTFVQAHDGGKTTLFRTSPGELRPRSVSDLGRISADAEGRVVLPFVLPGRGILGASRCVAVDLPKGARVLAVRCGAYVVESEGRLSLCSPRGARALARAGDAAAGYTGSSVKYSGFQSAVLSLDGRTALFTGFLTGKGVPSNTTALWFASESGDLQLVLQIGRELDALGKLDELAGFDVSNGGQVLVDVRAGAQGAKLLSGAPGKLQPIQLPARAQPVRFLETGELATLRNDELVIVDLQGKERTAKTGRVHVCSTNSNGKHFALVRRGMEGRSSAEYAYAAIVGGPLESPRVIVREGDQVEIAPGEVRRVSGVEPVPAPRISSATPEGALGSWIDRRGRVLVWLAFEPEFGVHEACRGLFLIPADPATGR